MTRKGLAVMTLAGLVAIVAASGCTGTDALNPGNFRVRFVTTNDGGTAGLACATLTFGSLRVSPLDPQAATALGSKELGVIAAGVNFVDFAEDLGCNLGAALPDVVLPSGVYRIIGMEVKDPFLQTDQQSGSMVFFCPGQIDAAGAYPQPLTFNVGSEAANSVRFVMDVPAVMAAAQSGNCAQFFNDLPSFLEVQ